MMNDILLDMDNCIFSYRAAGILIHNGRVLLQKPINDDYAFPGGHVAFGEKGPETLIREFKEEVGFDIEVGCLEWVEENFFMWDGKPCHQICLSYAVKMKDTAKIPFDGSFIGSEYVEDDANAIYFYWIPLDKMKNIAVYPANAAELLNKFGEGVKHLVYREDGFLCG